MTLWDESLYDILFMKIKVSRHVLMGTSFTKYDNMYIPENQKHVFTQTSEDMYGGWWDGNISDHDI